MAPRNTAPLRWAHAPWASAEAGVDEAGRGSLAGPVFAAAVVWGRADDAEAEARLRAMRDSALVRDSKKLSALQRAKARAFVEANALAWGVGRVEAADVDEINVLRASMRAMRLALDDLHARAAASANVVVVDAVLVDGDRFEGYLSPVTGDFLPHACAVDGDALYLSVAAASVLAKTHRDAYVLNVLHPRFPAYAWDRNKGYGTPAHLAALAEHGPCAEHRRTFAPVAAQWMPSGMNDVQT